VDRLAQDAFKTGIQFACHCRDSLVPELAEQRGGPVIFEDRMPSLVLLKHDAQRRVEGGRQPVPCHPSGGERIADLVLHGLAREAGNAQQSAMIPDAEDAPDRAAAPPSRA
jgi:hypothetical protein